MDNAIVIAIIAAIIAPPLTVGLPLAIFQWRQNLAMESRLRTEIKAVAESIDRTKRELEGDIEAVEKRLNDRIDRLDDKVERLVGESEARLNERLNRSDDKVERLVGESEARLNSRIDRSDDKIDRLIGDVGLVKGAVIGLSAESGAREPVATS